MTLVAILTASSIHGAAQISNGNADYILILLKSAAAKKHKIAPLAVMLHIQEKHKIFKTIRLAIESKFAVDLGPS